MHRPLRIAQVSPYGLSRFGGVRSHILGLGEALVARGHTVTVIAPEDTAPDHTSPRHLGTLPVRQCGRVHPVQFSGTCFDVAWASPGACRSALARDVDVLHLHTPWNPILPIQLAAMYSGVRVATFHDVAGLATPRWAQRLMPVGAWLLRHLVLDRLIGVSPAVSAYLGQGTHQVIPNGVDELFVAPGGTANDEGHLLPENAVVFLGRLEARKDVSTLLQAMQQVTAVLGDATPSLVIMGDGPLRGSLELEARQRGLARVNFTGAVSERTKWQVLSTAQCLVATSRAGESFGIVLLEAMRAGTVPIAADNAGYRHVLSGEGQPLCFPAGDAGALAERLLRIVQDRDWRNAQRRWCDQRWREFTWARVAEAVEAVYLEALARA